jgi:gamma-glutamylputrescine oxidase
VEGRAVSGLQHGREIRVALTGGKEIVAGQVLVATNAQSLELSGLQDKAVPKLTMGVATAPLSARVAKAIGLAAQKPFYTVDLPYLWGRLRSDNSAIFGAGLVNVENWEELHTLDVTTGRTAELLESVKKRVRGLHPALRNVRFTHAWGGPILLTEKARPIFLRLRKNKNVLVLGGYNGHGVALSTYLGRWAAEAMLGKQKLPRWDD